MEVTTEGILTRLQSYLSYYNSYILFDDEGYGVIVGFDWRTRKLFAKDMKLKVLKMIATQCSKFILLEDGTIWRVSRDKVYRFDITFYINSFTVFEDECHDDYFLLLLDDQDKVYSFDGKNLLLVHENVKSIPESNSSMLIFLNTFDGVDCHSNIADPDCLLLDGVPELKRVIVYHQFYILIAVTGEVFVVFNEDNLIDISGFRYNLAELMEFPHKYFELDQVIYRLIRVADMDISIGKVNVHPIYLYVTSDGQISDSYYQAVKTQLLNHVIGQDYHGGIISVDLVLLKDSQGQFSYYVYNQIGGLIIRSTTQTKR